MSKKSCFRGSFAKQHGKRAQALFKSPLQHLCHIHRSLARKLSCKKSLLFTCQILGLLLNILATDEKYPVLNRENLRIPVPIQLSKKQKNVWQFFAALLKARLNFKISESKGDPHRFWYLQCYGLRKRSQINV